jgi:hypothetical protein
MAFKARKEMGGMESASSSSSSSSGESASAMRETF